MINYQKIIRETIKECEVITGIKCNVPISFNERLSRTLGRASAKVKRNFYGETIEVTPIKIEFSKKFIEVADEEHLIDVVKHEYAHYCTFITRGEHSHSDYEFISYCKKMDCCHKSKSDKRAEIKHKYDVYCDCCGKLLASYDRATKVVKDIKEGKDGYGSSCCKDKLRLQQNW